METGDGGPSSSSAGEPVDAAEIAALEAEIARLTLRRDELRARLAAESTGRARAGWYPDPSGQYESRYWDGLAWTDSVGARVTSSDGAQPAASAGAPAASTAQPAANWYPDPSGRYAWRYWDGRAWTDSVARNGVTYKDPLTPSASPRPMPPSRRETPAQPWPQTPEQAATPSPTSSVPAASQPTPVAPQPATSSTTPTPSTSSPVPPKPPTPASPPKPARPPIDIDVGKVILFVGAALLIGGIGGLTAYMWSRLPAIGQLGLLGLAAAAQIVLAIRIHERLRTAAEAFAVTGVATMLFAAFAVSRTASWDGTVGLTVGIIGILLLVFARFRTWVVLGHLAIVVGAVGVLVAEPWSQTALIIAVVLCAVRWFVSGGGASLRSKDIQLFPEVLTAGALAALLSAPAFAITQFDTTAAAAVFVLVALVVSEINVRTRDFHTEHMLSQIAGAVVAVGGVGWSGYLWFGEVRSDGLAAMVMTGVVAGLLWRASRTESAVISQLTAVAAVLVPVAARFACDPGSEKELIVYFVVAATAGIAATRMIAKPMSMWFWLGAVASSIASTEQLPFWPRFALVTVALASLAVLLQLDELRYLAAIAATLTVADVLYGRSFDLTWWFRPDVVGASAGLFLYVAVRTRSKPLSPTLGTWAVPTYWESAAALLAVPVVKLMSTPAMLDLPNEGKWRLGLVGALTVTVWGYGAVRRSRPNAFQIATGLSTGLLVLSRVGDESLAVQTGAWVIIGCIVTAGLAAIAHIRKIDELRYVAAATGTGTVAILLYGQLITVTWWFRPDMVGASAALFLFFAVRTRSKPLSPTLGTWAVPKYWESAIALLAVPVVKLMSTPAMLDLPNEGKWRLGLVGALTAGVWGYGAVRRTRPNAFQVATALSAGLLVVSRVGDESLVVQTGAWVIIGCVVTAVLATIAHLKKIDLLRYAAAASATATVAVLLYGQLIEVAWWFRPDMVGASAAIFLFVAVRTMSTPREVSVVTWKLPRYWEPMVALLVVPTVNLFPEPALASLANESKWRLGFVLALTVLAWAYGALKRTVSTAPQVVSTLAMVVLVVSRVADVSLAVQTGAWILIGCIATVVLAAIARVRKNDDLWYASAATATASVAVLLYGQLIEVTWWFRPDVVGASAAVFLFVAVRMMVVPREVSIGTWKVPRYWEPMVALLAVPTTASKEFALADLSAESKWRVGFVLGVTVAAWAYGAARRTTSTAAQAVSAAAMGVLIVSRLADESQMVRASALVLIGAGFIAAALMLKHVELLLPAAVCWVIAVVAYSPPGPLEVITCSFAAIAALVAFLARRFGRTGSFDFIPAGALALVPSAFAAAGAVLDGSIDSEQVARITVVLVVGAIALAIGTYRRLAALVGPSLVALIILAVAQLIVVQRQTSGWVSALVAGVVLLVVGTRLEYLRSVSRRASDLVRSLH